MVANYKSGLIAPIHVQKHIALQLVSCSNNECADIMLAAGEYNPSIECEHLEAVKTAQKCDSVLLHEKYLNELVEMQALSQKTRDACIELQALSEIEGSPLVVFADFESMGYSGTTKYYSVYAKNESYYSKYKRVRVTFSSEDEEWSCQCPLSRSNQSCVHEAVGKWYMFQYQNDDFKQTKNR